MKRLYLFLFATTIFASTQTNCAVLPEQNMELKDEKEGKKEKGDKQKRTLNLFEFTITDDKELIYNEDKRVVSLAYICNQKDVTDLDCGCTGVNDHLLKAIADSLPSLEILSLLGCKQITDEALITLSCSSNLKKLDLYGCDQITDEGIKTFVKSCTSIEAIDLGGCRQITEKTKALVRQALMRNVLRKYAARPLLVYDQEKIVDKKKLEEFIKSLEMCTNITSCQGLDSRNRLFGDIDFEHLYSMHDQEDIKEDQEDRDDKIAQRTNEILSRIGTLKKIAELKIIEFIANGQKCLDGDISNSSFSKLDNNFNFSQLDNGKFEFCGRDEHHHGMNLVLLAVASFVNTFVEKIVYMVSKLLYQHVLTYGGILSSFIRSLSEHFEEIVTLFKKQHEFNLARCQVIQYRQALQGAQQAFNEKKTYGESKQVVFEVLTSEQQNSLADELKETNEEEIQVKESIQKKRDACSSKILIHVLEKFCHKSLIQVNILEKELQALQDEYEKQITEFKIKIKLCAITVHALFICLEQPKKAQEIAQQTKKALMSVDKDIAQEGYDFITRAISKLQEEVSNTIRMALAFNMGHLKAFMFQSTALVSDEKDALDVVAQHASSFDCKESMEEVYERYTAASFNYFKASKEDVIAYAIKEELENARMFYQASRQAQELHEDAQESLQQRAQNKQASLTHMHQQARECIKVIKAIFEKYENHLLFNLNEEQCKEQKDMHGYLLKQAQGYLDIIKNNERLAMRTLVPVSPVFDDGSIHSESFALKLMQGARKCDDKEEVNSEEEFQVKRRKTGLGNGLSCNEPKAKGNHGGKKRKR